MLKCCCWFSFIKNTFTSALHSVVVGEEGLIVCSLWGTVTRSYKGGLVTGNLVIGNLVIGNLVIGNLECSSINKLDI